MRIAVVSPKPPAASAWWTKEGRDAGISGKRVGAMFTVQFTNALNHFQPSDPSSCDSAELWEDYGFSLRWPSDGNWGKGFTSNNLNQPNL